MPESAPTWVRKYACPTDLSGGLCIADDEILTHHASRRGSYNNAPRPDVMEVELSIMRGRLTTADACTRRNGGRPAHPRTLSEPASAPPPPENFDIDVWDKYGTRSLWAYVWAAIWICPVTVTKPLPWPSRREIRFAGAYLIAQLGSLQRT
jgi:hypothetical protein